MLNNGGGFVEQQHTTKIEKLKKLIKYLLITKKKLFKFCYICW